MADFSWTDLHDEDPLVPGSGDIASAEHLNILGHEAENLEQNKQDVLVDEGENQNIKTINGNSILGSGNLVISGGGDLTGVKVDGTAQTVTDGYVNLQTKNGNYDSATNMLATQDDLYTDEVERLDRISYYGQDIEPSFEGITIEWVGGANGRYEVTGYEQGYIGTQKVIPYKFNDGTHRENSVAAISDNAFQNCSFYNITLPNSIISIGDNAFDGCSNLSSITIPDSVVTVGDNVFDNAASGFKVYCDKGSAMATYCETNDIPYVTDVNSDDLANDTDWKVIGFYQTPADGIYTSLSISGLSERFFNNYNKFKIVCDFDVVSDYPDGNYFTSSLYFLTGVSQAYKLYYSFAGDNLTRLVRNPNKPATAKDFHCKFNVEKWINGVDSDNNVLYGNGTSTTLLPLSYSESSTQYRSVSGGSNPGIFVGNAVANDINGIRLANVNSAAPYIKNGSILLLGRND